MHLYIIRHGLSQDNQKGFIQGHADSPLSDAGRAQANLLGRYLEREKINPEMIYSSPLKRAHETSTIISQALSSKPAVIDIEGFKEVDVGRLSGLTIEQAHEIYPGGWSTDINRWLDFSRAGGEGFDEFFLRIENTAVEIIKNWDDLLADRIILFVTHAGVMRPLLRKLLNTSGDFMYFTFGNCCHVRVEYRPVGNGVRKVLSDLIRIEKVAQIMGEKEPACEIEDSIGKKMG
jgi:broad specificity phosphatase PhoE